MTTLDFQLAGRLAEASAGAYRSCPDGAWINNPATDTQVLVIQNPIYSARAKETIIAFRGTDDFRKWVHDAEILMMGAPDLPAHEGRLHAGVCRAVESVIDQLAKLCRGEAPDQKIFLTGHSFGGGCAPLAAYLLAQEGINIAGVQTFAGMRFCDPVFKDNYTKLLGDRTVRWVAQNDVVPHLPLPAWGLPYRHCPTEAYLTEVALEDALGLPTVTTDRSLGQMLWADARTIWKAYRQARTNPLALATELPREMVEFHNIGRYQRLIRKLCAARTGKAGEPGT